MIKFFIENYKNLDKDILHILKIGIYFSFFICILSTIILFTYLFYTFPYIYYLGILIFSLGINLLVSCIISAPVIDSIKKQIQ